MGPLHQQQGRGLPGLWSRTGKFVVHVMRSQDWSDASGSTDYSSGWRGWVGNWSSNQTWTSTPVQATLTIVDSLQEMRDMLPPQLYDVVADAAGPPRTGHT